MISDCISLLHKLSVLYAVCSLGLKKLLKQQARSLLLFGVSLIKYLWCNYTPLNQGSVCCGFEVTLHQIFTLILTINFHYTRTANAHALDLITTRIVFHRIVDDQNVKVALALHVEFLAKEEFFFSLVPLGLHVHFREHSFETKFLVFAFLSPGVDQRLHELVFFLLI